MCAVCCLRPLTLFEKAPTYHCFLLCLLEKLSLHIFDSRFSDLKCWLLFRIVSLQNHSSEITAMVLAVKRHIRAFTMNGRGVTGQAGVAYKAQAKRS